jgi:hypothetical protein
MIKKSQATSGPSGSGIKFLHVLLLLGGVLTALFCAGWLPGWLIFSNDGPLGAISGDYVRAPEAFTGIWADLNWLGTNGGSLSSGITGLLQWILQPVLFSKFYAAFALLFLGTGAWFFFRELGFTKLACVLGGLAATLNGDFVATACWGVASQPICFGLCYFAMGLIANLNDRPWTRTALAGLLVGLGVMEASDIGAIFSVFVAAWVTVHALVQEGTIVQKVGRGVLRLALVSGCAAFIAANALSSLIGTQIQGVVGMAQDEQTKAARWGEATQWSLPKREILDVVVPGLYGFRMDTPHQLPDWMQKSHTGGAYWGFGGRGIEWDQFLKTDKRGPVPGNFLRYGMGGGYAGTLVLVGALWAIVQSFRGQKSFFSAPQRKLIWFWLAVLIVATGLMFGRFAPFYQFLYALPFASTFRNPAKFLHVFEWSLVILFAYGIHGLTTLYLERATATTRGVLEHFGLWRKQATGFDKKWVWATMAGLGLAIIAWLGYHAMRGQVEAYVSELNQFATMQQGGKPDPASAAESAAVTVGFSLGQVRWAVISLAISVGLLALLVSGAFAGQRARMASILLIAVLAVDLGWQARPWVIAQNYQGRYIEAGNNPVFDFLRTKPYEHRVGSINGQDLRAFQLDPRLLEMESMFQSVYGSEWTQHLFPYNNIQTLSVVQMPRRPLDYDVFESTFRFYFNTNTLHNVTRRWELSNTRYIAGAAPLVNLLNQGFDSGKQRFKSVMQFDFYQDRQGGPILIRTNENGRYAIIEFTGALPRAKLYTDWQAVSYDPTRVKEWTDSFRKIFPPNYPLPLDSLGTNDLATLELLARASFDPTKSVLLAEPVKTIPTTNAQPGNVDYVSYSPKHIVLKTRSTSPTVLLLNDRYDPAWQVTIDGKPAPLLRCNYLMRGVHLEQPGEHTVEFIFRRPMKPFYISLTAIVISVGLLAYLALGSRIQSAFKARSTT